MCSSDESVLIFDSSYCDAEALGAMGELYHGMQGDLKLHDLNAVPMIHELWYSDQYK
jgi:hypothetical protein